MSEPLTLARPYARAAFETARAHNALAAWSGNLRFAAQVMADARVSAVAGDPRLSHAELVGLLLPPGESAETPFAAFLSLLVENRRVNLLAEVAALFEELKRESERTIRVILRSASEVPAARAAAITVDLA
mgnify:FL=1